MAISVKKMVIGIVIKMVALAFKERRKIIATINEGGVIKMRLLRSFAPLPGR